jgi:hypothetical protein
VGVVLLCVSGAVAAAYAFPIPAFVKVRGEAPPPAETASVELGVYNLTCRGKASLLQYFLTRDDLYAVDGYLKLEAWPGSEVSKVVVRYDPDETDAAAIKEAIVTPYYDRDAGFWRESPFRIEGYDPLESL